MPLTKTIKMLVAEAKAETTAIRLRQGQSRRRQRNLDRYS